MQEINYNEAVELMLFAGRTDVEMWFRSNNPGNLAISDLYELMQDKDVKFFVPDDVDVKPHHTDAELAEMRAERNDPKAARNEQKAARNEQKAEQEAELISANEPEPDEPEKPVARKVIDMGKVKALRKAGWSAKKIADEMGVCTSTIYNYLTKMEAEG